MVNDVLGSLPVYFCPPFCSLKLSLRPFILDGELFYGLMRTSATALTVCWHGTEYAAAKNAVVLGLKI